jgi:DNA-binding response OmpR family regulator
MKIIAAIVYTHIGSEFGLFDQAIRLAELLVRVKALFRRGPVNRSVTLRVSDLELDGITQHVKRAGEGIELTTKE